MEHTQTEQTEQLIGQTSVDSLLSQIYSMSALPPFSLRLEFVNTISREELQGFLGKFVMFGAHKLFNKNLHELTADELERVRKYLMSIGYDLEYTTVPVERVVTDYHPDGTPFERVIKIFNRNIMFMSANQNLNPLGPGKHHN